MSFRDIIACGSCEYEGSRKSARKWCTNCEEGLCEECEKGHRSNKSSRDHKLISTEDYRKISDVPVIQICDNHGKKFDFFCKTHDEAICVECVPSQHKKCPSVIPISEAAKNAKKSIALSDLEKAINGALKNMKGFISERETEAKNIDQQVQEITKTIQNTRVEINKHLDELERKLLDDIAKKKETYKSNCSKTVKQLNSYVNELKAMQQQTTKLKQFASDLQVFLSTRQFSKMVAKEIDTTKSTIKELVNCKLKIEFNSAFSSLKNNVNQLGAIHVEEIKSNLSFRETKIDQAQIPLRAPISSISNTRVQLKQRFSIKQDKQKAVTGCVILPDNRMLIADRYGSGKLMEYNDNGQYIRDIPVSGKPFDITVIDLDRIAVTSVESKYMEIINITNNVVQSKIQLEGYCYGISYQDGKLYTIVLHEGIVVMDLTGKMLHNIDIDVRYISYLTVSKDRIFYTKEDDNTVHCCSLSGDEIWVFRDDTIAFPQGITVDNNQNVYVVGENSNNLTVIQHDGKVSKTLLTKDDGLERSLAVYYRKDTNTLMIGDKPGSVALYNVT